MSVKWQKVRIGDVAIGIYDGPHATPPECDVPGPYYLGIPHILPSGHIDLDHPRYIAESDFGKWTKRVVPQYGDVLFSYEATLNLYACVPKDFRCCLGRRMGLVRPDPTKLDTLYLYYYFFSPTWRKTVLEKTIVGATVDRLPIKTFPDFPVLLPPIPVQKKIASILSAYDDLLENNRRRIAILEEMARKVYRKRFGGKKANGTVLPLCDVAEVCYGKDHKSIGDGIIPIFGSGGIMRYGNRAIYDQVSVLVPRKGSIGNVMYCDEPFWTVDTMFYTRLKIPNMAKILYYQLCAYDLAGLSTGAAVPSMTTDILNALRIFVPDDESREKFEADVGGLFAQKQVLIEQNKALATARDALLPKLMSGRIDVDGLEVG